MPEPANTSIRTHLSERLPRETWIAIAIYAIGLVAYALPSGARLRSHSNDNHFVHLAYGWLHGRLDLGGPPPHSNDWSQLEWVTTNDGHDYKGTYVPGSGESFKTIRGKTITIPPAEVKQAWQRLQSCSGIETLGLMTHLANADDRQKPTLDERAA